MNWSDLVGQDRMTEAFQKALAEERLAHGILLWGPEGTGKSLTANILRTHWLCLAPLNNQPCGKCKSCELKSHQSHPDDIVIDVEENGRNIGIEAVRQVGRILSLAPNIGAKRVIFFPKAGSFTLEAANSLLKLLEEPPLGTLFLLEAQSEEEVLPTILSRCQSWRLSSLPESTISDLLVEKHSLPLAEAHLVSRRSGGSLGIAIQSMNEEGESVCGEVLRWMLDLPKWSSVELVQEAMRLDKEKKEQAFPMISLHIEEAKTIFRDLLIWQRTQNAKYITHQEWIQEFDQLSNRWNEASLIAGQDVLEQAQEALKRNGNPRLWSEWLWIQLRRILDNSKDFDSK